MVQQSENPATMLTARPTSGPAPVDLGDVFREYMEVTARLQRTHENLQREVERLREELARKDRELERRQRLAALGELAAGVAHEVRNPLGAIQLYSGLLRRTCAELSPALQLIEKIDAGIGAIDAVVRDTLALAPRPTRLERQALEPIVRAALEFCQPVFQRREVQVGVSLPEGAEVAADAQLLQRVLINLLSNAAEAAPAGSLVELCAERRDDDGLTLRVADCGGGLPPELLDQVFNPFFTTKATGTGLGLTIAHRLTEAHGGRLGARNRAQGGAEFSVELPAVTSAGAARPAQRAAELLTLESPA